MDDRSRMAQDRQTDVYAGEADERGYMFGPFTLIPNRQLLLCDGDAVRIGARAFEVLTCLVRHAGEVVPKEDLTSFVWPDTFVHESNLKVSVASLRRVLADACEETPYIATVQGRGYRFVQPVTVQRSAMIPLGKPEQVDLRSLPRPRLVIGRAGEIGALTQHMATHRWVTIVGPGGSGKTTVAVALAHDIARSYADGVCFIDLSTIGDAQYLAEAIATALGIRLRANDVLSGVVEVLRHRRLLVVMDNCEHLLSAVAAAIDSIQAAAPHVTVLATSREPLRGAHEYSYRLPTMGVPGEGETISAAQAMDFPAVALFVACAARKTGYVVTDADVPAIVAICRRLDGIALAIELAASKMAAAGPEALLDMLEQRFRVLSHGPRSAPLRQQTMLATLDWSYRLLSDDQAMLLRCLGVFAGFFSSEDAVFLAKGAGLDSSAAIDGMAQLVSKSLLAADCHDGAVRYRLLECTRDYARERLNAEGEAGRTLRHHARLILSLFERAEAEWFWRVKRDWMAHYATRVDDLRKAIAWAFGPDGEPELGVRLTAAAIPLWDELSSICEARTRVRDALEVMTRLDACAPGLHVKLVAANAWSMTFAQPMLPETEMAWRDCQRFADDAQSVEYQLRGRWGFAVYLMYAGRHMAAIDQLESFTAIATSAETGASAIADGERLMANAEIYVGRLAQAVRRLEPLARQHASLEERSRIARFQVDRHVAIHGTLGLALWFTGSPSRALRLGAQAVDCALAIGHVASHTTALALWVVPVAFWSGDLDLAARYLAALDANNRTENIALWIPVSRFFKGAIRFSQGMVAGIDDMRAALVDLVAGHFVGRLPMYQSILAEALLATGDMDGARACLEEAEARERSQNERWCRPEILRVQALVRLKEKEPDAARQALWAAITQAREIGALSLELRAALVLTGLWEQEGRVAEAYELLAGLVEKFAGESGSADLGTARNRLIVLNQARKQRQ